MKRMIRLLGVVLTGVGMNLSAQTAATAEESEAPAYRPFTLGLEGSTTGPGVAADWRFSDHFGARVGFNYFSFSKDGKDIEGISYNTDNRLMSEPLALDIYPWKKSTFRVTVGVLLNQSELEGEVPQDPVAGQTFVTIGNNSYDSANIGTVNMKAESDVVAPYISVGMNFYLDKARHWSIGGEVGVAYTGTPDVTMSTSSGLVPQPDLDLESQQVEDDAWSIYPIVKLSVNYSF